MRSVLVDGVLLNYVASFERICVASLKWRTLQRFDILCRTLASFVPLWRFKCVASSLIASFVPLWHFKCVASSLIASFGLVAFWPF